MQNRNLYDIMQDPNIPADRKRMILDQLQQQAKPDSSMPATIAALLADAAAGTVAGSWLNKGDRADRYFGGISSWLQDKVQPPPPDASFGPVKPGVISRARTKIASAMSPKTFAHLSGNVLGGMGMGVLTAALVDGTLNQDKYKDPLEGL